MIIRNIAALINKFVGNDSTLELMRLKVNDSIFSENRRFHMIMQSDGNLVLYGPNGAVWNSATMTGGSYAVMKATGTLIVKSPSERVLWSSRTHVKGGAKFLLQNDGNFVIYSLGGTAIWSTKSKGR